MIKCTAMLAAVHTALCHKWGRMQAATQGGTSTCDFWLNSCVRKSKIFRPLAHWVLECWLCIHDTQLCTHHSIPLQTTSKTSITSWSYWKSWSCHGNSVHHMTILQMQLGTLHKYLCFAGSAPDTTTNTVLGSLAGAVAGTAPGIPANKQHEL